MILDQPFFKIDQWHSEVFFSQKMILAEIQYKIYNDKLFAIVEILKTLHSYSKIQT